MATEKQGWSRENFSRRKYTVAGEDLDKAKRIELHVIIDGKRVVQMQAREPGLLAFVSKPDEQGFDIEVIEPTGPKINFTDRAVPEESAEPVADWQFKALGM